MKSNDGFVRSNTNPGAVLNVDNEALENYRRYRASMHEIFTHENRLKKVEQTMDDVKSLLEKLLEKAEK